MNKSPRKQVSVILPTYNRARLLPRAIASVLGQTYADLELIIVDDASSDDTEAVVRSIRDPRVRYFKLPDRRRQCHARNFALTHATGEWIAFQDSDDIWLPDRLERQVEVLARCEPDVALVFGLSVCVGPGATSQVIPPLPAYGEPVHAPDVARNARIPFLMQSWLMRRSALDAVGHFDEKFHWLEDWDLAARIFRRYRVVGLLHPCCLISQTEGSLTADGGPFTPEVAEHFIARYCSYFGRGRVEEAAARYVMAVANLRTGRFGWGRNAMWQVLSRSPFEAKAWLHAPLSLLGQKTYRGFFHWLKLRQGWLH